jgi:hypothetical protein
MEMKTCPHCKTMVFASGLGNHIKSCAKKSPEERALVIERMKNYASKNLRNNVRTEPPKEGWFSAGSVNGGPGRVQITLSVDIRDLKGVLAQLIPSLSVVKVEVA